MWCAVYYGYKYIITSASWGYMTQLISFNELSSNASGVGSQTSVTLRGRPVVVDIILDESTNLDITLSRVLPDGTEVEMYTSASVVANTTIGSGSLTPGSIQLSMPVKVDIANAGEHDSACIVYITLSDT